MPETKEEGTEEQPSVTPDQEQAETQPEEQPAEEQTETQPEEKTEEQPEEKTEKVEEEPEEAEEETGEPVEEPQPEEPQADILTLLQQGTPVYVRTAESKVRLWKHENFRMKLGEIQDQENWLLAVAYIDLTSEGKQAIQVLAVVDGELVTGYVGYSKLNQTEFSLTAPAGEGAAMAGSYPVYAVNFYRDTDVEFENPELPAEDTDNKEETETTEETDETENTEKTEETDETEETEEEAAGEIPEELPELKASLEMILPEGQNGVYMGDTVTLRSHVEGDAGCEITREWQVSKDNGATWETLAGETGEELYVVVTDETFNWQWRMVARRVVPEAAEAVNEELEGEAE